jgi:large subunit ribosomal protein L21
MGQIVEQTRGPKVYAFKKRRRKNSKRKRGHKQDLTVVRIVDIIGADGKRAPKAEAAEASAA